MKILESVSISGLWRSKTLTARLFPDVNFLIGANGSGKTTVINLIAAALTADFSTLGRLDFDQIQLKLRDQEKGDQSMVTVSKVLDKSRRLPSISYRFRDSKSEREHSTEEAEQYAIGRRFPNRRLQNVVLEELGMLVKVRWLSIHRTTSRADDDEDESYESTVDRKLDELTHELIKFFSKISSAGEAESEQFQKTVFTSLLYTPTSQWDLITSVRRLNLEEEKAALQEIFRKFRVPEYSFSEQLTEHFHLVESSVDKTELSPSHLIALVSMRSIHRVVTDWQNTVKKQLEISKPKEQFLTLLNEMMKPKKRFSVDDKNQLQIAVEGRGIQLSELSSGEKQMLILLGEALLQEREHWIYIADEPELSLHVKWQETLTDNLRQINPNAQVIFATHSPDIVGPHEERVLNMEDLLR